MRFFVVHLIGLSWLCMNIFGCRSIDQQKPMNESITESSPTKDNDPMGICISTDLSAARNPDGLDDCKELKRSDCLAKASKELRTLFDLYKNCECYKMKLALIEELESAAASASVAAQKKGEAIDGIEAMVSQGTRSRGPDQFFFRHPECRMPGEDALNDPTLYQMRY
jgi:hypothetical protein